MTSVERLQKVHTNDVSKATQLWVVHVLPDWLKICFNYSGVLPRPALLAHPDHQYGNSMLIPQSSFQGGYH